MRTNKKVVRLTESKLKQMIAEAVQETLNEYGDKKFANKSIDEIRQMALGGDIDAWVMLGVGTPRDYEGFEKWRREKLGLRQRERNHYDWKDNPNDGRQFSPEWWH